jgi:hypothetical protein
VADSRGRISLHRPANSPAPTVLVHINFHTFLAESWTGACVFRLQFAKNKLSCQGKEKPSLRLWKDQRIGRRKMLKSSAFQLLDFRRLASWTFIQFVIIRLDLLSEDECEYEYDNENIGWVKRSEANKLSSCATFRYSCHPERSAGAKDLLSVHRDSSAAASE